MKNNLLSFLLLVPTYSFVVEQSSLTAKAIEEIVQVGYDLNAIGLCQATAGNFSARLDSDHYAITVSGTHKGELTPDDVIIVNKEGQSENSAKKPSAETALHMVVYRLYPQTGAILHTHSVNGTVLSRLLGGETAFVTQGYEIHKAFQGISTHDSSLSLPIFENSQDYVSLSAQVGEYLETHPQTVGFLLRGHGLYTWGKDLREAKIRTEAFEFLFECELKMRMIRRLE